MHWYRSCLHHSPNDIQITDVCAGELIPQVMQLCSRDYLGALWCMHGPARGRALQGEGHHLLLFCTLQVSAGTNWDCLDGLTPCLYQLHVKKIHKGLFLEQYAVSCLPPWQAGGGRELQHTYFTTVQISLHAILTCCSLSSLLGSSSPSRVWSD